MKKIKLFFLAFLSVCLWLTSFSNASTNYYLSEQWLWFCYRLNNTWDCLELVWGWVFNITQWVYSVYYSAPRQYNQWSDNDITFFSLDSTYIYVEIWSSSDMFFDEWGVLNWYNCDINYLDWNRWEDPGDSVLLYNSNLVLTGWNYQSYYNLLFRCDSITVDTSNMWFIDGFMLYDLFSFPWWNITALNKRNHSSYNAYTWSQSNLNQCLEDKNLLIWQVSTLSWSLSSCQSDLSNCNWWQDASLLACINQKEQCESSLNTLSWNYASLENMNSSLSSQLQECLESWWSWSSDLICNKFDLFWSSDNTNYSYPINNDLILPPWYKGFVNEGVLAIKQDSSLDSAYAIDDEEFQDVIDSFGIVFLYIFGSSLFLVFLYMIRKYFIWLKS